MELGMSPYPSEDEDDTVPTEYLQALNDTTNWQNIEHTASTILEEYPSLFYRQTYNQRSSNSN